MILFNSYVFLMFLRFLKVVRVNLGGNPSDAQADFAGPLGDMLRSLFTRVLGRDGQVQNNKTGTVPFECLNAGGGLSHFKRVS